MQNNGQKLRFWYGIFLSALTVAVAVAFIIEAAQIYYAGAGYSRELVGEKLLQLLAPFIIWILAIVGGFVLSVLFEEKAPLRAQPDARKSCRRLAARIPQGEGEEFQAEQKKLHDLRLVRVIVWAVASAFALAAGIIGIVYIFDIGHFPASTPNVAVLGLVRNVLTWVAAAFVLFIGATVYDGISAKKELASVKRLIALGRGYPVVAPTPAKVQGLVASVAAQEKYIVLGARILVAVLAVTFIALGVWNGGMHDVLMKAVKICTECIGLG